MAININITVPNATSIFDVDAFRTSMEQALHKIAWEAQDFWVTIAGQRLKSSRILYQESIKVFGNSGENSVALGLEGPAWLGGLELGSPAYKMNVKRGQIVPMNMNRQIIFTNPQAWVRGSGEPWNHPGFPGFNMRQDVVDYISDELAPKHIGEAISDLMGS
jgi:hypothetical protein